MKNTFIALATPYLTSAIAIIRINGDFAYDIVNKITKNKLIKKGYSVQKLIIYDEEEIIDESIFVKFVSPRSFTGDDLIEINCHGGPIVIDRIMNLLIKNGARMADKGEFSKRAFINNKINLFQANAINNLINAKTNSSAIASINGLINKNRVDFENIKEDLFALIGKIEVNIDYPEYDDVEVINNKSFIQYLKKIIKKIDDILSKNDQYNYIYSGINVAIVGKPNVGKSSLLNCLLQKDKAIVSNIAGTTRDIVNDSVVINDILFNFIDTAGIRKSSNKIENLGIKKSNQLIKESDFVIYLIDKSQKINEYDLNILNKLKNKKHVIVKNKKDIKFDKNKNIECIEISTKNNDISILIQYLTEQFKVDKNILINNSFFLSKDEKNELNSILKMLNSSIEDAKNNITLDVIVENITYCYKKIVGLLGNVDDMDLIDKMFKNFCLGK